MAGTWPETAAVAVLESLLRIPLRQAERQILGPLWTEFSALLRVALDRRLTSVTRAETGSPYLPAIFDLGQAALAAVRRRSARADTAATVLRAAVAVAVVLERVLVVLAVAVATAGF